MTLLLHTSEIRKIESRYVSLFDRTVKKGLFGVQAAGIREKVKVVFGSATFRTQLDNILNDLVLFVDGYTSDEITEAEGGAVKNHVLVYRRLGAASDVLPLTEELVKQSTTLADEVSKSIIEILKDEGIYELNPNQLELRIRDIWGGQKYKSKRFAQTFTSQVSNETALQRYKKNNVRAWSFSALLDDRTTLQCRMLHGTIFYTGSDSAERYKPPLHFNCRSGMKPIAITETIDESLVFENRDFTQLIDQDTFEFSTITGEQVTDTFGLMEKYKDDYELDRFMLQEDIEKRLLKMKGTVTPKLKTTTTIKKVKKLSKSEQRVKDIDTEIAAIDKEKAALMQDLERVNKELEEIGYDPADKVKWKLWQAKDAEYWEIDKKWMKLASDKDFLLSEKNKLLEKIAKQQIKNQEKQNLKSLYSRMPPTVQTKADDIIKQIPAIKDAATVRNQEIINRRMAIREERYAIKLELEEKYNKIIDDYLSEAITETQYNKLDKELDVLRAKIKDYDKEIKALVNEQTKVWKDVTGEIHNLISINEGTASSQFLKLDSGISGSALEKTRQTQIKKVLDFVNQTMTKELRDSIKSIQINELGAGGRAYTKQGVNAIWVSKEDDISTIIHELGHNLEFDNEFLAYSAKKQLTDRTAGEQAVKLLDLLGGSYREDELTKKDNFFHAYVGKQYSDGSTEVTSMALQYLYQDPLTLYEKDKELFTWIVNAIRGHYV